MGATEMNIHISRLSQPSRSVLLLCAAAEVEHTVYEVDLRGGEHKTPEYRTEVNPCGFVPALVEEGLTLAESGAIMSYICDSRGLHSFYPSDPRTRAKVNFWLFWNATGTRLSTMRVLRPRGGLAPADPGGIEAYTQVVQFLEERLGELAPDSFLAGTPQVTIADLMIIPELDQLSAEGFGAFDYEKYPQVTAYMKRVAEALGTVYTENFAVVGAVAKSLRNKAY